MSGRSPPRAGTLKNTIAPNQFFRNFSYLVPPERAVYEFLIRMVGPFWTPLLICRMRGGAQIIIRRQKKQDEEAAGALFIRRS